MTDEIPVPDSRLSGKVKFQKLEPKSPEDARPPAFTDEALALQFANIYKDKLRYVAAWARWLHYDGQRWRFDDTLLVFDPVRKICRKAAAKCKKPKIAAALASAKTVAAVERLARADRCIAASIDQWDADKWLLNTPAGMVNLKTGRLEPHRPHQYLTKIAAMAPDASCPTPLWTKFIDRITGGDPQLGAFLARVLGYALTGTTDEHAIFFNYGTGANGKSVLTRTAAGIFGDYHVTAPIETFTASKNDRHPTELARLRGARLVTATETEEGRCWAESLIKTLTGGDKIPARFMRQDFFEYQPQFKLLIAGNRKPALRTVDEAIRRRFHLIPFRVIIPPDKRDPKLTERLRSEWPGILDWMIKGCLEWQARGLDPPEAVLAATAAYLDSEDAIAAWIDECCERDASAWESSANLFDSWKAWAQKNGEDVGSKKGLVQRLESHGLRLQRKNKSRGLVGLRLRPRNMGEGA